MDAEGAELEILIGLSSEICRVIPADFAGELEHGYIKSVRQLQQPPAQQYFPLIQLQHQLPATSQLTVFFSHTTPATGFSSNPANRVN